METYNTKLEKSRIFVTGSTGFVGKKLCQHLRMEYGAIVDGAGSSKLDLRNRDEVLNYFHDKNYDFVFHLAGFNGGIIFNKERPFEILHDNTLMSMNILEACRLNNVQKVVSVVASCAYPCDEYISHYSLDLRKNIYTLEPRQELKEEFFFDGPTHPSVACHGYAKRTLMLGSFLAHQQYGLNSVCICPTTIYGPGMDFDPKRSKVLGAIIKKIIDCKERDVDATFLGTGEEKRELIYVDDVVKLTALAMLKYDEHHKPLNLGNKLEFSIKDLVKRVSASVEYNRDSIFEGEKTSFSSQSRKLLDNSTLLNLFPEFTFTDFDIGLSATIEDYKQRKGIYDK